MWSFGVTDFKYSHESKRFWRRRGASAVIETRNKILFLIFDYCLTRDDKHRPCSRVCQHSYSDAPHRTACFLTVMMVAQILLTSAHCTLLQNTEALCHPPLWNTRGRCTWRRTRVPCCCASLRAVQHRNTGKTGWCLWVMSCWSLLFSYKSQQNRGYRYFLK